MTRLLGWTLRQVGSRTLLIIVLLLLSMASVAGMVAGRIRGLENSLLISVALMATVVTWLIARSRAHAFVAIPTIAVIGCIVIVVQVGNIGQLILSLIRSIVQLGFERQYDFKAIANDLTTVAVIVSSIFSDLYTLGARVTSWINSFLQQKPVYDPVATALFWSGVFWLIAAWAAWAVRRCSQGLVAFLPSIALLLAICAYTGVTDLVILVWPMFTLLILMALVSHGAREAAWQSRGIDYSEDIRFDLTMVVTPISALLVATAWFVPLISLDQITSAVQQALSEPARQAQPVTDSLGLAPRPAPTAALPALRSPGLPRSHLIGTGPELSTRPVMSINTGDLPPQPYGSISESVVPRYYWRSTIYDHYNGNGWTTSEFTIVQFQAGTVAISPTIAEQRTIRQQVQLDNASGGQLYASGSLLAADRDFQIAWRSNSDSFNTALIAHADSYTADSTITTASVEELRATTLEYPDWIKQRYLQLPNGTPQRLYTLARDLTATEPTPFDRANAIEAYLRTFSYTLDIPVPPIGRDVADYFIFDLKRGYCDYFATSMVVLARAAGLPARMVVGYATGDYDRVSARYKVTEADAHSWPEVYFNEYGWIEFEPTSGQSPLTRPGDTGRGVHMRNQREALKPAVDSIDSVAWVCLIIAAITLLIAYPIYLLLDWWITLRISSSDAVRRIFEHLPSHTKRLGVVARTGDTSLELVHEVTERVRHIAAGTHAAGMADQTEIDIVNLCDLATRASYSRYRPSNDDRMNAWRIWQRTSVRLWILWFIQGYQGLRVRLRGIVMRFTSAG